MSLNGDTLAAQLKNAINSIPPDSRDFDSVWNLIGETLVNYIVANAVVTVTVTGTASGVTTGVGAAPVTGSGTGIIS